MAQTKICPKSKSLEELQRKTSWTVSHAIALKAVGPKEEAEAEWLRAAELEEDTAFQLEAEGFVLEAAVHRVSAASCYSQVKEYPRAITLLRAALSIELRHVYRASVEKLLKDCLKKIQKRKLRKRKVTTSVI
jgi:tetratricopeptide (TPR) repeat protein